MELTPKIERMAGLGALAVCGGLVVVYLGFLAIMWPNRMGGSNPTQFALVAWAVAVPTAILIGAHVALARQLLAHAAGRN